MRMAGSVEEGTLIRALSSAVTSYDGLTGRHSSRVGDLAGLLAAQLDLDRPDRLLVQHAGVVHDLGKLGVSSAILDKPGRLTPAVGRSASPGGWVSAAPFRPGAGTACRNRD